MALVRRPSAEVTKTLEGQFNPDDPVDLYKYWQSEFRAAREEGSEDWPGIKAWQERGNKVVKRYRARRSDNRQSNLNARLNVFPANIQTQRAILVGQTPKCEVTRRFDDVDDDVARIAADMLKRILNAGLEEDSGGFASTIAKCTEDRLLPGMCGSRVHFDVDMQQIPEMPAKMGPCRACQGSGLVAAPPLTPQGTMLTDEEPGEPQPCPECQGQGQVTLAPALPAHEEPQNERADVAYIHWRDQLWSTARVWEEVRWMAFSADLGRKQLKEAFGEEGAKIPLNLGKGRGKDGEAKKETPWSRARVWEIWSKEHRRIFYLVEGHPRVFWHVDNPTGEDVLGLDGFFPSPRPMMANATTDAFLPTPDYDYAKDLYDEADDLTSRIRGVVRAIKVAGAYDKKNRSLQRLLDEACELELIPVENWTEFMQKGGIAGAFQLLPVQEMVQTVAALVAQRNLVIESIYQITGLGDIIRGQQQASETATTSAIKARFASVRLQDLQKEVARYATDLQRIRKEVIAKHFSIPTIIERSNIMQTEDGKTPDGQQKIAAAAQLIKDRHLDFRVMIKPEQISLQDWAQLKQQRTEVLAGLGQFFGAMMPLLQMAGQGGPGAIQAAMDFVLHTGQWLVSGLPGASGVESAFDSFAAKVEQIAQAAAQQPPQPPPPDPKVVTQQVKNQGEIQKTQAHTQSRMAEIQAETQAEMAKRQHDAQMTVATTEAQERIKAVGAVDALLGRA